MVASIRKESSSLAQESDAELRGRTELLRERLVASRNSGLNRRDLISAGSIVVEAIRRTLNVTLYDVQLLAGLSMAHGAIAEMQTGEGKTLSAVLPAFVHGLRSQCVHVVTANQYLADRDFKQTRPALELLGLRSAVLPDQRNAQGKIAAYDCDITYGAGYEFGFDYLRDQVTLESIGSAPLGQGLLDRLKPPLARRRTLQRKLAIALIDEVDHVLIDDACSPLVLSDAGLDCAPDVEICTRARDLARRMEPGVDLQLLPQDATVCLTPAGIKRMDACFPDSMQMHLIRPWQEYVEQSLIAEHVLKRDVQYVVRDHEVQIIDVSTGRIFENRFWSKGLHQAVQVKEGLPVTGSPRSLAQICRQRFFRQYGMLSGMTGTALECRAEFARVYGLKVDRIPLNRRSQRTTSPTRIFQDHAAKWRAIADSVASRSAQGQPVLVGTRCISDSLELAARLSSRGCSHQLLNGLQDEEEAEIVARAGIRGAVTISTNLAGRGTDIRLGPGVAELGGLHVIAADHQESRRLDRQLMGRCARQGDPGSVQFFMSADDELLARHAPWLTEFISKTRAHNGEVRLQLSSRIAQLQRHIEHQKHIFRHNLLRSDLQRTRIIEQIHGLTPLEALR
ncbi:MAG: hypothetical protein KDA90_17885 [Planctomycetaceae bacterium]|nr:hypothetical protein [Planctomycetaceae bacterium]